MRKRHWIPALLFCGSLLSPLVCVGRAEGTGVTSGLADISLEQILTPVGKNVQTFVETLQDTTCLERVEQRSLRTNGKVRKRRVSVYDYLFTVSPTKFGISVYEMRREKKRRGGESSSQFMMTNGFPAAVLIFHPDYSADFDYQLLGRDTRDGREALMVGFRQNPQRKNRLFSFRANEKSWPVYVRGKAWIDASGFQVLALEMEMLEPNPQVGLLVDKTHIEYREVFFTRRQKGFWVPIHIEVQLAWRGRHFQNEHTFSEFRSFEVETKQTIRLPATEASPEN